jgi:hypothetical protein
MMCEVQTFRFIGFFVTSFAFTATFRSAFGFGFNLWRTDFLGGRIMPKQ